MGKSDFKRTNGKGKHIQWRYRDRGWICVSTRWIRWAKRYMNKETRRTQKQEVQDDD